MTIEIPPTDLVRADLRGYDYPDSVRQKAAQCWLTLCDKVGDDAARALVEGDTAPVIDAAIERMGWPEINAFNDELHKGQGIYEDAGGYFIRCIKALFGVQPRDPVVTYREAAEALVKKARESNDGR